MDDRPTIDDSLVGKRVVTSGGEEIGLVSGVRSGTVYVERDPGLSDRIAATLGWDDVEQGDQPVEGDAIDRVTEETVHLSDR